MKTATPAAAARPAITSTIGVLSDDELLRHTSALVRHERHLQGAVIDHLAEIEARSLYLRRGCSSLFDYAVRELGYSDAAAGRRIGAVRLCADQPDVRERLRDGSLTLSAAAELQWAFDRQRRRGSIAGTASSAPAGVVATRAAARVDMPSSAPSSPAEVASTDDPLADEPAPLVLDAAGRQRLVEEASGKSARQVRRMLADLDPELAPPADRVRPLGEGRYELKAVIDADCQQGLEHLRGLLSHVDPRMTVGQLLGRIAQAAAAAAARRHSTATTRAAHRAGRAPAAGRHSANPWANPCPLRQRKSGPPRNPVTLSRCMTRRSPPTRLRRRSGRHTRRRPRRLRRPDGKRRTAEPLPTGSRPAPPLRRRSRALRAARFRRRCDGRCGSGTAAAAATSTGGPDAAATHDT